MENTQIVLATQPQIRGWSALRVQVIWLILERTNAIELHLARAVTLMLAKAQVLLQLQPRPQGHQPPLQHELRPPQHLNHLQETGAQPE